MATSGSIDLSPTRNSIIRGAFRLLGFKKDGGVRPAQDVLDASEMLNMMISAWQADDYGLWLNNEATLYLDYETSMSYTLGSTGDHATLTPQSTAIATAASSGDSTITVDSDDNITNGDAIGIELDDNTMQWTTVNGVPASNVVTLTAVLTDDVAVDNVVYNYTTKLIRPLSIIEARLRNEDGNDTVMNIVSRNEYMAFADKDSTGVPNTIYYDPQLTNGVLYVYPISNSVEYTIKFTGKFPVEIFDAYGNSPDFPQQWLLALQYNLAVLLAPEYPKDVTPTQLTLLIPQARALKEQIKMFDTDNTSIFIQPKIGY